MSEQFSTYCVLTRVNIGSPKYGGTFSSINECVLMKFKVASGSARESLWHEPGLGSGICTGGKAKEQELNKQIAADSTKERLFIHAAIIKVR